jgi:hypothetical protein
MPRRYPEWICSDCGRRLGRARNPTSMPHGTTISAVCAISRSLSPSRAILGI